MNTRFKLLLFVFFPVTLCFITACTDSSLPQPSCRVNASYASNHQGSGACIVVMQGNLLVTQGNDAKYHLAFGEASPAYSAQCVAHRAMWRETGFNVEVQSVVGVHSDGTWLFACNMNNGFNGTEVPFASPEWSSSDVNNIAFIDPFNIERKQWRDPKNFVAMRDAYIAEQNYRKQQVTQQTN